MILSQSCEYAIRAVLYIAGKGQGNYVSIGEISKSLDISFHFLTKILQKLTRNRLLISSRGPKGGIKIAGNLDEISILDIVTCVDGMKLFRECVLGLPDCNSAHPCPLHDNWVRHRQELAQEFRDLTVGDLIKQRKKYRMRLTGNSR